jgi:N-acetylglucosaminyldiphosphoundecaprenol N-acetyl-beta-D-mannosaminyltransferase
MPGQRPKVQVGGLEFDALTEAEVIGFVSDAWTAGRGGSIVTVNIDIARAAARSPELAGLVATGSLVVADGMPLVWAARAAGDVLPERVAGSSLITTLSAAAAQAGRSVFLLGGADGVPDMAARTLVARSSGLRIAGADSPPFGFDETEEGVQRTVAKVAAAGPDLVFVALGFPRQEQLISRLRQELPEAWFVGCGGAITMMAGVTPRAPRTMQRLGLEWAHRLALEPRRLARRYLRDDLPFAVGLLIRSATSRFRRRPCQETPELWPPGSRVPASRLAVLSSPIAPLSPPPPGHQGADDPPPDRKRPFSGLLVPFGDHGGADGGVGGFVDEDQAAGLPVSAVRVAEQGLGQAEGDAADLVQAEPADVLLPVQGVDV